jgi:hypothetical protein
VAEQTIPNTAEDHCGYMAQQLVTSLSVHYALTWRVGERGSGGEKEKLKEHNSSILKEEIKRT